MIPGVSGNKHPQNSHQSTNQAGEWDRRWCSRKARTFYGKARCPHFRVSIHIQKLRLLLLGGVSNNDQGSPLQQTVEEISGAHVVSAELGEPSAWLEPVVTLHLVQGGQER